MLTQMQRLDLMDQLDDLMISKDAATGMDKLDILDQIDDVMAQLGYGTAPKPEPEPTPAPEPTPPVEESVPEVVQYFRNEEYKGDDGRNFLFRLEQIKPYEGGLVTLAEIFGWADDWYQNSTYFQAS